MLKGVYKGFRATYAPLQMTTISGKALCISAGQCKTSVQVLDLPACSRDISPIENIWRIIKLNICQRRPQTLQQLETYIRQEWDQILTPKLQKLNLNAQTYLNCFDKKRRCYTMVNNPRPNYFETCSRHQIWNEHILCNFFFLQFISLNICYGLDINGCVLNYFEGTANLHCCTSCALTTLHGSKVSFFQCCPMKIYNKLFTKMWGVYSLLWDTVFLKDLSNEYFVRTTSKLHYFVKESWSPIYNKKNCDSQFIQNRAALVYMLFISLLHIIN